MIFSLPSLLSLSLTEIFSELSQALEHLRAEEFTWDEDINFLQGFIRDPNLQALLSVNDGVANSQGFDQPVGPSCEVTQEVCVWGRVHKSVRRERIGVNNAMLLPSYQILLVQRKRKAVKRLNLWS